MKGLRAALGAALMGAAIVGVPALLTPTPGPDLPACASDDGDTAVVCYWDAEHQGNGKGKSFIALPGGHAVAYVPSPAPEGVPAQCASEWGSTRVGDAFCAWRYSDGTELLFNVTGEVIAVRN